MDPYSHTVTPHRSKMSRSKISKFGFTKQGISQRCQGNMKIKLILVHIEFVHHTLMLTRAYSSYPTLTWEDQHIKKYHKANKTIELSHQCYYDNYPCVWPQTKTSKGTQVVDLHQDESCQVILKTLGRSITSSK